MVRSYTTARGTNGKTQVKLEAAWLMRIATSMRSHQFTVGRIPLHNSWTELPRSEN
jgi:hypothetical protein